MSKLPIIFLAFANEQENGHAYLRGLAKEQRAVNRILESAQDQGKCELIVKYNVTIDDVFDTFQKEQNQGRICIFHFAGHANSFQLLMESATGGNQSANADSLIRFLSKQKGLRFVFLNACSTQGQIAQLTEASIPSIATSQSINDGVATNFAMRFYKGLANNKSLADSFEDASDYVQTSDIEEGGIRDLYWEGADETITKNLPWEMHTSTADDSLVEWTLEKQRQINAMAEQSDFKTQVQLLVAKDKMKQALELALEQLKDTDLHDAILSLSKSHKKVVREERIGTLSFSEAAREHAKVTNGLLGLLGDLE